MIAAAIALFAAAAMCLGAPALALPVQEPAMTAAFESQPVRVLLLTGENNHNWRYTSRVHKDTLEASGRFIVDIADDSPAALSDTGRLEGYSLFVVDYNGKRWGEPAETNFLSAVRAGAGVVLIHAANNSFVGWTDYERLCGLMWINGKTGHGDFHNFDVIYTDRDHPITKGLPDMKVHPDELYHNLVNTQQAPFNTLAKALSSPDHKGTGKDEPMAMTLSYGSGRIFATPLGHVWQGQDAQKASISDPQFKVLLCRGAEWAATGKVTLGTTIEDKRTHNHITGDERVAGWRLLFDGTTTANWKGYKKDGFPEKGWAVKDGNLWRLPGEAGGDIVTTEEFGDFEFACDWRVEKGGNSGIIYRTTEDHNYPWETGPEYQILDDAAHPDSNKGRTRSGTLYDVFACAHDVSRPAGEWNHARIVVKGTRIEHWLNGFKVVDVDTASDEYTRAVGASKWTKYPDFNTRRKGRIALQDHGDEVRFRNIRIRTLNDGPGEGR